MNSRTTKAFWQCLGRLPADVRKQAREAYRLFRDDPYHSSLRFKQVSQTEPLYSVRVGRGYRAVALRQGEDLIWFWIGTHADYDNLLRRM